MIADVFLFLYTFVFIYDCYTIQSKDFRSGLINIDMKRNKSKMNILSIFTHVSIYHYMVNSVAVFIVEEDMNFWNIIIFLIIEKMYNKIAFGSTFFLLFYVLYSLPIYLGLLYVVLSYIGTLLWYV